MKEGGACVTKWDGRYKGHETQWVSNKWWPLGLLWHGQPMEQEWSVSSDTSIEDPVGQRLPGWPQAGWTACFPFLSIAAILIARSSPPWFIVDRPFLFFIRHNPTGRWFSSSTVRELLEFRKVDGQLNPTVLLLVCFYVAMITNTSNNITNHPPWKSGCVYKVMESFKQGQDFRFVLFFFCF